jgi:methyltransferase (TIGR00027 family)
MMSITRSAMGMPNNGGPEIYLSIRTRFLDDALLAAVGESRAFRLNWPAGITMYEIDRDDVFNRKEEVLRRLNAQPACDRRIVRADLAKPWIQHLLNAGCFHGLFW